MHIRHRGAWLAASLLLIAQGISPRMALAQPSSADMMRTIMESRAFAKASDHLSTGHEDWVRGIITLSQIPAPPFKEQARAAAFAAMLAQRGLETVGTDEEGNVLAHRKGAGKGILVVSAHLDSVFAEGTDVTVRRQGNILRGPGVGDDSSGLATLLALADAMDAAGIATEADIMFVGTVGEEGAGELRGVRHLFTRGAYRNRITAFISLDNSGLSEITTEAIGSRRFHIVYSGPGGHSFADFGVVNPMVAMAKTVEQLYRTPIRPGEKSSYSASIVHGGSSINAVPSQVTLDVDLRSGSAVALDELVERLKSAVSQGVDQENRERSTVKGTVSARIQSVGDRPAGRTEPTSPLVRFARAAYEREGIDLKLHASSTDANIPMSLDIPAVTLSRVAVNEGAHSTDEWIDVAPQPNVRLQRIALAIILATAGFRPDGRDDGP